MPPETPPDAPEGAPGRAAPQAGPTPPDRPVVAVLAVVARGAEVLLVRRANPPDAGLWGYPGGKVEAAETLAEAAVRELFEETGVRAHPGRVLDALDVVDHAPDGTLRFHYVLVAIRCEWRGGAPVAADDALEARWVPIGELWSLETSDDVDRLARMAAILTEE
ncbi:NUDIX hydrolase [Acidimangrovimonas sediminis]|uniref:NUDIX hydrolase n=1 Tax=Acidimangrovimonas sediminis TaxID=2056283 RepID=UPI000C800D65|nr:NUDIX hydrolase [Acidimangrovimonas sediminis]